MCAKERLTSPGSPIIKDSQALQGFRLQGRVKPVTLHCFPLNLLDLQTSQRLATCTWSFSKGDRGFSMSFPQQQMCIECQRLGSNPRVSSRPLAHTYSHTSNYGTSAYSIRSIKLSGSDIPKLHDFHCFGAQSSQ